MSLDMTATCPKCGIEGLHACPGKKLQKPTPEQEARLREVLAGIAKQESEVHASSDPVSQE